jgi:glycosyltransferase involved in cell wall biosynthesis
MARILADKDRGDGSIASKVRTVPLWADERRIRPLAPARRPRTSAPFTLLYAGNMGRVHDMETILEAAAELAAESGIRFRFVGEGYKKARMEAFARSRGLANCRFETYVPREELGGLLASAGAGLVCLTRGQEGLSEPCKTLGLMAAGRPVIGILPRDSEMAGVVRGHRCGVVVEPGDVRGLVAAVKTLARRPRLRAEYGRRGREAVVKEFSLGSAAVRYRRLLTALQPASGRRS